MLVPVKRNGVKSTCPKSCRGGNTAAPGPASPHRRRRKGATSLEYLFVASLIITVAIIGIQFFSQATNGLFQKTASQMPTGKTGP